MSEDFKVGDRVKVEFEGVIKSVAQYDDARFRIGNDTGETGVVYRDTLTKISTALPTKVGTVVDVHFSNSSWRFILTIQGWHYVSDSPGRNYTAAEFRQWITTCNADGFTVVLEG